MFRKTVLAVAAIAALATATTVAAPTTASAGWKHKHHHHHHHHRNRWVGPAIVAGALFTGAIIASSCYRTRWVETPYGLERVRVNVC
jgi:hypothetical protein